MKVDILMGLMHSAAQIHMEPSLKRDYITVIWPEGSISIDVSYQEKCQAMSLDGVDELIGKKLLKEIVKQCRENLSRTASSTASAEPMPVAGVPPVTPA